MHLPPSLIILRLFVRKLSCWQTNKQTRKQTNSLCWFSQRRSPTPQLGGAQLGGYNPKFELDRDFHHFCTMHLPPSFIILVQKLSCWQTANKHTNKQTPLKTSNALRYATSSDSLIMRLVISIRLSLLYNVEYETSHVQSVVVVRPVTKRLPSRSWAARHGSHFHDELGCILEQN